MLSIGTRAVFVLFVFLLVINLFAFVIFETSDTPILLTTLLDRLEDAPKIDLSLDDAIQIFHIDEEWAVLDGFRVFINALGSVIGFIVYIVAMLLNLLAIIFWFLYLVGLSSTSAITFS